VELDEGAVATRPPTAALTLSLKPRTKAELDQAAESFLNDALEIHGAAELVVLKKQMETLVEYIDAKLKADDLAFNAIGEALGGLKTGEVLGANVRLTFPARWQYDAEAQAEIGEAKNRVKLLENKAQLEGHAVKVEGKGVITVTLKGGE
jgi:hypothetical protein